MRRNKYNAIRTEVDGIKFDSRKEAGRYCDLKLLQKAGDVSHMLLQVPFVLDAGIKYKLDFLVFWTDGHQSYEDVKGIDTPVSKLKRKQVEFRYPIKIELL